MYNNVSYFSFIEWLVILFIYKYFVSYMGHGAGNQYYNKDLVCREVFPQCATSLLLGCSSGALAENGMYEPTGTVNCFLLTNSPCVLSTLWDVTSNECDRMGYFVLDQLFSGIETNNNNNNNNNNNKEKKEKQETLTRILAKARDECKLTYLTGSAMICYGLPIKIFH
jgi:separase